MRKTIATLALAAAAVLAGSGSALAHGGPGWDGPDFSTEISNDTHLVEVEVDHTVVVCGDFSECEGDEG
ncbi:hypothetical protein ACFYV5_33615 [Streptomyces sp. NPDC003035]|uniref:hypothetical protein n=1 Tax=unclassified Streptomyces TaxID=2593676 RepID=UPI0033B1B012